VLTYFLAGAGVVALLLVSWNVWANRVNRRLAQGLVSVLDHARDVATWRVSYRSQRSDEQIPADMLPLFEAAQRDLDAGGWNVLGDLVEQTSDGKAWGTTRWFMDDTETVVGWFGVVRDEQTRELIQAMTLFSDTEAGDFVLTGRGVPKPVIAQSPGVHRTYLAWDVGLTEVLQRHRSEIAGRQAELRRYSPDLGAGPGVVQRLRETNARWRRDQMPDALLVLDVHAMLEPQFEPLGPPLLALLRARAAEPVA
jgi:hypothetical protein